MKIIKIILLSFVVLILLQTAYSAGIASPYSETMPLVMAPGQTHEFYLELQNMVGDTDLVAKVNIDSGKEFVEILDGVQEYPVSVGDRVKVNLKVNVPEDTKEGDYTLNFNVKMSPIESSGGGMVQLDQGFVMVIPLQVKKGAPQPVLNIGEGTSAPQQIQEEKKGDNNILLIAALVVLLIAVLIILFYRKKK